MDIKEKEYMTLDEINKRLKEIASSLTPKEADSRARINACKAVMKTKNLGFLLLCYNDDGGVEAVHNLTNPEMRNLVFSVMREILVNSKLEDLQFILPIPMHDD